MDGASEPAATPTPPPRGHDLFGGLTVQQAIQPQHYACHLRPGDSLGDLAEALASSGRSALGVVAEDGALVGMATVNDIMRAYFEGVPATQCLSDWLQGAGARAPPRLLRRLAVRPSAPVADVLERMVSNAVAGDCACHHVLVQEQDGHLHGVVSSQDLLHLFCHRDTWRGHALFPDLYDASESSSMLVRDVMKDRDHVFTCEPQDTLRTALKTLLVTRQNSLLVIDDLGVYGLLAPLDLVKAFADVVSLDTTVSDLIASRPQDLTHKTVPSNAKVLDAVAEMAKHGVDHLVVLSPTRPEAVGILSSLDLVLHTRAREPVLQAPTWSGPSLGEVLRQHPTQATLCSKVTTLGMVCGRFLAAGQTSLMIQVCKEPPAFGLLTEGDLVRAFIAGHRRDTLVGDFLLSEGCQHAVVPQYLQVPPSTRLTDAGALMLSAVEPGRSCHHLVVRAVTGGWLGVFSALDMARALHGLSSKLEEARSGMDALTVESIMKPVDIVPTCVPSETIKDVLGGLDDHGQSAVLVADGSDVLGLLTPRCAVQALADNGSPSITVGEWMRTRHTPDVPREIPRNMSVKEAADMMTDHLLHHLLVVDVPSMQPVGVLSALDMVRAVVSSNQECPFLSLGWLRRVGVPTTLAPPTPPAAAAAKRPGGELEGLEGLGGEPAAKLPRFQDVGA